MPLPESIEVRPLSAAREYEQAVELQRITWGAGFRDVVPAALLKVTQRVGGVTVGAFDGAGTMLGFVYGLTGFYAGALAHWSHMLAVRPELRDQGIGLRLKEHQRARMAELGIEWIYWTFDPLVARNAHLNLNRLGTMVREYIPDMYGNTGSELHAFGTDRLVVGWRVGNATPGSATSAADCRIEVPQDVAALTIEQARDWRQRTRKAFLEAFAAGYSVTGFDRDASAFLLTRKTLSAEKAD